MTPILRRILFAYCLAICVKGQAPVMAPASVPVLSPDVVPVMAPAPLEMPLAPAPSLFPDQIAPAPTVPELIPVPPEEIERLRVTVVEILNFTGGYITVCDSSRVLGTNFLQAVIRCDAAQAEVLASGTNFTTCPAACADANAIVGSQCVAAVNTALVQLLASKSGRGFQLSNFSLGASEICGMGLTYQGLAVPYEAGVTQFWLSQVNVSGVPACNATTLMARGASNFMSLKGQCNVDIAAGTAAGSCPDTCTQAITMATSECMNGLAQATTAKNQTLYTTELEPLEVCGVSAAASAPAIAPTPMLVEQPPTALIAAPTPAPVASGAAGLLNSAFYKGMGAALVLALVA